MTPEQLFSDLLAAQPAKPFVTYYDEASGERSELSAKSLANWVAKTHHLLIDELGLGVGDSAFVAVPAHWISVPVVLGSLTAGLALLDADAAEAEVAFVDPSAAELAVVAGVPDVYAVAPASAAQGFGTEPPAGTSDYVSAVRPQADKWPGVQLRATGTDPGIGPDDRSQVVARATLRARELGLEAGARAITTRAWTSAQDWIDTLLAPLTVGGSIVLVANCPDADTLERRAAQERASVRIS